VTVAVDEQHDGEPDAHLGGGDGDDEEGEDLTSGSISSTDSSTSTALRRLSTP